MKDPPTTHTNIVMHLFNHSLLSNIDKFERMKNNLAINVYHIEGKDILPLHISKTPEKRRQVTFKFINQLLYNKHYCLINNFSRLVRSQITSHKGASLFCHRCLGAFSCQTAVDKQEYFCEHHKPRRVTIPNETVKFNNYNHSMPVPVVLSQISNHTLSQLLHVLHPVIGAILRDTSNIYLIDMLCMLCQLMRLLQLDIPNNLRSYTD
jgi:hypothetical protein